MRIDVRSEDVVSYYACHIMPYASRVCNSYNAVRDTLLFRFMFVIYWIIRSLAAYSRNFPTHASSEEI